MHWRLKIGSGGGRSSGVARAVILGGYATTWRCTHCARVVHVNHRLIFANLNAPKRAAVCRQIACGDVRIPPIPTVATQAKAQMLALALGQGLRWML